MNIKESLTLKVLAIRFDVAECGLADFDAAIADGTLLAEIQANADEACGGNILPVVESMLNNVRSKKSNFKLLSKVTTGERRKMDMALHLEVFLKAEKAKCRAAKSTEKIAAARAAGAALPRNERKWYTYSQAELESVSFEEARRVRNCMASFFSKGYYHFAGDPLRDEKDELYDQLYNWLCDRLVKLNKLSKAKKLVAEQPVETKVETKVEKTKEELELVEKLRKSSEAGKTAVLSKAQVEALLKILG